MDEFSFIAKYFRPIASNFPGSLNLADDAAILTPQPGQELVITKDAISQGIHFIGNEDPALIAAKALRVNLSDLAAMGATPLCYFLALMLPKNTEATWLEKFAGGLKQTGDEFAIALAGGDTTSTNGSLSISITAIGSVPAGTALKRSGAKEGDDIYVSGTLGDAAAGLKLLQNNNPGHTLVKRYMLPEPRIGLGTSLRAIASSAMDISDGLIQDLGHICAASQVGATINSVLLPINNAVSLEDALSGGDDYELLFTASPDQQESIIQLKAAHNISLIGKITSGSEVKVIDQNGEIIKLTKKGFSHF